MTTEGREGLDTEGDISGDTERLVAAGETDLGGGRGGTNIDEDRGGG